MGVIKQMYSDLIKDPVLVEYFKNRLNKKHDVCSKIIGSCDEIIEFLDNNLNLELCEDIDKTQQFDINFIKSQVDAELDEKTNILFLSTNKLEAIRLYFNESIIKYEKKTSKKGNSDYVKFHETEKSSVSLVATKRRCNILKEMFNKSSHFTSEEKLNGIDSN